MSWWALFCPQKWFGHPCESRQSKLVLKKIEMSFEIVATFPETDPEWTGREHQMWVHWECSDPFGGEMPKDELLESYDLDNLVLSKKKIVPSSWTVGPEPVGRNGILPWGRNCLG